MNAPILITAYCRPTYLKSLLVQVRELECRIYIFVDGPSINDTNEKLSRINDCKRLVLKFADTQENVRYRFAISNLGLSKSVTSAIDWVFENEDSVIVLEDDLHLHSDAIQVANKLLVRYKQSHKIGSISLYRPAVLDSDRELCGKVLFSPMPTSWGWATWVDRWQKFNLNNAKTRYFGLYRKFFRVGGLAGLIRWRRVIGRLEARKIDSWAYPWMFTHFSQGWMAVIPKMNLVENLGFGEFATHTKSIASNTICENNSYIFDELKPMSIPNKMKKKLLKDTYGVYSFSFRIMRRMKNIFDSG